jgi:hypothetical protein
MMATKKVQTKVTRPPTARITHKPLECFTIREPVEEVEVVVNGKKQKVWRFQEYHYTTDERPVTHNGVQYIPVQSFHPSLMVKETV